MSNSRLPPFCYFMFSIALWIILSKAFFLLLLTFHKYSDVLQSASICFSFFPAFPWWYKYMFGFSNAFFRVSQAFPYSIRRHFSICLLFFPIVFTGFFSLPFFSTLHSFSLTCFSALSSLNSFSPSPSHYPLIFCSSDTSHSLLFSSNKGISKSIDIWLDRDQESVVWNGRVSFFSDLSTFLTGNIEKEQKDESAITLIIDFSETESSKHLHPRLVLVLCRWRSWKRSSIRWTPWASEL